MDLCYLNGRIVARGEARIDPLDRGFVFGDAIYEVIKILHGAPIDLEAHLERLGRALQRVSIPEPAHLAESCRELIGAAALGSGSLYLQISRGVAPRSHAPPADLEPTVLIVPNEHGFAAPASRRLRARTLPDPRWVHCDLKTTSLMATVTAYLESSDADEVLFAAPSGELREGGHTNLFVKRKGVLETHPLNGRILAGVTRGRLLELAARLGLPCVERAPTLAEVEEWDEAFLCGTRTGVQPLTHVDGREIAGGKPGGWTRRLAEELAAADERRATGD